MPRLTYSKILARVEAISLVTNQDDLIKDGIQMGLDRATMKDLPYLMTEGVITTVAPYETGTVTVSDGSKTVTGLLTVFTAAMVGRKIRIGGENAYYRIAAYVSGTEITLKTAYRGDLTSANTYSIYKDEYKLPADIDVFKVMRQIENNQSMVSLDASAFDIYEPAPQSQGDPKYNILSGTERDTYTTGTIAGTVNTSALTGTTTAWLSAEGLSKGSRLTAGTNVYTVKSVDSDTGITIYEKLVSTLVASAYTAHLNNYIIQLFEIPDSAQNIYFRYQRIPDLLINDEDIPDLPDKYHYILVTAGLIWAWMTKDKEESTKQEALFQGQVEQMWGRIGNVSRSISFPRMSQDNIAMNRRNFNLPSGYGVPIPR
jgi:hypothetical protein